MSTTPSVGRPWAAALASVIFSVSAHDLLSLYARLHWPILHRHYGELAEPLKTELFTVMGRVGLYRMAAATFALGFAIWAITAKPRWVGIIVLGVSLIAVYDSFGIVM